jgi:outer membrane protein TolC
LGLANERHRLGAASKVDVSRAALAVGEDRVALVNQKIALEQANVELNRSMGRPPDKPVEIVEAFNPMVDEHRSQGVNAHHARLLRSDLSEEIASLDVELAEADLWPSLSGFASYARNSDEFSRVYSRFDDLFSLSFGVTLNIPVFEGFATMARIEAARAQWERSRFEKEQVALDLSANLVSTQKKLLRLQEIQRIEPANVDAAALSLVLAEERYKLGKGTDLEVRDAQLAVIRAKLRQVQTQFDLQIERARYHKARGDLLSQYLDPKKPIDQDRTEAQP